MTSLVEFAAAERKRKCYACRAKAARPDLWAQILEGRRKASPISYRICASFLTAEGLAVSETNLIKHFLDHENGGTK